MESQKEKKLRELDALLEGSNEDKAKVERARSIVDDILDEATRISAQITSYLELSRENRTEIPPPILRQSPDISNQLVEVKAKQCQDMIEVFINTFTPLSTHLRGKHSEINNFISFHEEERRRIENLEDSEQLENITFRTPILINPTLLSDVDAMQTRWRAMDLTDRVNERVESLRQRTPP